MTIEEKINHLDAEIEQQYLELSELRANAPATIIKDYEFLSHDGGVVKLSELFGERNRLVIVHNMGRQCPYCTVWADGFSDSYYRFKDKFPFWVTSKETVERQKKNMEERNWQFPMVSSHDNQFLEELGFRKDGAVYPGLAFICKSPLGELAFHGRHNFGPGDQFGMLWHMFDLVGLWDEKGYKKPE